LLCTECTIEQHTHSPLHRLKTWNGTYFEEASLANLGLVLNIDHEPTVCLVITHSLTVMDINGLHNVRLSRCWCLGYFNLATVLFHREWIPATLIRPGTAFTFRVMKQFQMMSHVARTTPWDFCTAIQQITDNIEPDILPDIYRSFNRIQRHWRVARAYKRGGITSISHNWMEHKLGLPCVSCPWPNKNIPDNW
ncbi:hypothetical protein M422DRAFT_145094, partial [Sphaerobolus stellatus SS14]